LRSHCSPNSSRKAPTNVRRTSIGTSIKARPNTATSAASPISAAAAPSSEDSQLRVLPTARTTVSASTASTAEARKTEATSVSSAPLIDPRSGNGRSLDDVLQRDDRRWPLVAESVEDARCSDHIAAVAEVGEDQVGDVVAF
jgi:hypothetical protein